MSSCLDKPYKIQHKVLLRNIICTKYGHSHIESTLFCILIKFSVVGSVWLSITKSSRRKTKRLKLKGTSLNKGKR